MSHNSVDVHLETFGIKVTEINISESDSTWSMYGELVEGRTLQSRLRGRWICKLATWSKVENIVSIWSRVEGRGEV